MRRREKNKSSIIFIIIIVIIVFAIACKFFMNRRGDSQYKKYVGDFSSAIEQYGNNELENGFGPQAFSYNELKNILISKGYFIEFENPSVSISGDDITISKSDNVLTYYNYNNLATMENTLQLKFNYNGKEYVCTKNLCK